MKYFENMEILKETTITNAQKSPTLDKSLISQKTVNIMVSHDTEKNEISIEKLNKSDIDNVQQLKPEKKEDLVDTETINTNMKDVEVADSFSYCDYNWNNPPKLLCETTEEYQPTESCENFTKGCQWSPDGTCLLTPSEDFRIRIYDLPKELYTEKIPSNLTCKNFAAAVTVKEGGLIYDTCWYPFMSSWEPRTCCFLSTSRESPIHLWDAFNGELRATYRAYNQVDEVEASISIQFIDSAREVWAGFKNALRIFEMERPGRQINTIQFKKDFPNVTGLVSCIRENPIMPGLVAFGTYCKYIGLYKNGPLCSFKTKNGVTQIEFSSCGTKLFSVVRRTNEFLCWDLRNPGTVLYSFQGRQSDTNQRIQFDITPNGEEIVSGSTEGNILVWKLSQNAEYENVNVMHKIKLSDDCINGISIHKRLPIIATATGQRLFQYTTSMQCRDNSVRLWSIS